MRLARSWLELREHQDYPPAVQQLLGEAVGAVVLLAATLKFDGTLTLQLQGKGLVNLLVAQCTHDFQRARHGAHDPLIAGRGEPDFRALAGEGSIIVTVEATDRASSYQGVVPITGDSLAECLEAYFVQSEQLPTRVVLAATPGVVSGMLVQRIPGEGGKGAGRSGGARVRLDEGGPRDGSADARRAARGRRGTAAGAHVRRRRSARVRRARGDASNAAARASAWPMCCARSAWTEVRSVIAEQGAVTVTCEFCQKPYKFDAIDAEQLFDDAAPRGSSSIN